jgi:adenosine deaminase
MDRLEISQQPKAELHVHLEGSIGLETANAIAMRKGIQQIPDTLYDVHNFEDFFSVFLSLKPLLRDEEDFYQIALDFTAHQAADTIVYTETFFQPSFHVLQGVPPEAVFRGIEKGLARGCETHGIRINLICSVSRLFGRQSGFDTLDMIEKYSNGSVVGIDLSGKESPLDPGLYDPVFQRAKSMGLKTVVHSGEFGPIELIRRTVDILKPDRIGHGISAWHDEELVARLADQGVPLEICPTSNVTLGAVPTLEEHPVKRLHDMGADLVINTDDPAVFGTTLTRELELLRTRLGFTDKEIPRLIDNGFRFSFLGPDDRDRLRKRSATTKTSRH